LSTLWLLFINGFLTLLPFIITAGIISFSFKILKFWFSPLKHLQEIFPLLNGIPHSEFIIGIGIIFVAGIVLKSFVIRYVIKIFETLVNQVPLISLIYISVKQLVQAFSPNDTLSFKQVILVEFPRKGLYSLGFQTTQVGPYFAPNQGKRYFNVFLPTTPNPTTGVFLIVAEDECIPTKLNTQEAMTLIISGGIVQPDRCEIN
jgi:uncharacterized membrane protein